MENAIEVNNLHIIYKGLKKMSIKQSITKFKINRIDTFEALKGVSFNVEKGKILGIIGKNGSGKSTLLRAIAGIFSPDSGTIDLKDNTVSLLSIGAGFQNKLTEKLSGIFLKAGNIRKDGKNPSSLDCLLIQRHILEIQMIEQ